ncbi:MAG TPA: hypothetical protein VGJ04_04245, partial [Pirellulales bacterium]
ARQPTNIGRAITFDSLLMLRDWRRRPKNRAAISVSCRGPDTATMLRLAWNIARFGSPNHWCDRKFCIGEEFTKPAQSGAHTLDRIEGVLFLSD